MESIRLPVDQRHYRGKQFPYFPRPQSIGEYTINRERKIKIGRSDAKYFYERAIGDVNFDLNVGFETFDEKEQGERLDKLLDWIMLQAPDGKNLKKALHEAEFVSWRGLLSCISCTPFNTRDSWKFQAVRQQGVIFLCEEKTPQALQREAEMTQREKLMTYWGHKFEQYTTSDNLNTVPNTSEVVSTREEFTLVTRARIQVPQGPTIKMAYGAEIDAINSDGKLVEMKTQRQAMEGGFWRQKSLKWWIQSYLVGIEDLIVGFRDDNGIVFRVDVVRVDSLPRHGNWDSTACLNFLGSVLSAVRSLLPEDGMRCQAAFERDEVTIQRIPPTSPDFLSDSFKIHFGVGEP